MSFSLPSMLQVAKRYIFDFGHLNTAIFSLLTITAVFSFALGIKRPQILALLLIIGGLMGPYVIMPNHVFDYYAVKWLAWEILGTLAILGAAIRHDLYRATLSAIICTSLVAWILVGLFGHSGPAWYQSRYLIANFQTSKNIQNTLEHYRTKLNTFDTVGVIGIGPGQIINTPWQSNGETAFFLKGDLGVKPDWILFVTRSSPAYRTGTKQNLGASGEPGPVKVNMISALHEHEGLPLLVFAKDGRGQLYMPGHWPDMARSEL